MLKEAYTEGLMDPRMSGLMHPPFYSKALPWWPGESWFIPTNLTSILLYTLEHVDLDICL